MAEQQGIEKINVDEVEYAVNELPDNAKALLSLYQEASAKMIESQRQSAIMEASRRALGDNIIVAVRQWNAQRVKELQAAANAAANNPPAAQQESSVVPLRNKGKKKATADGTATVQ